ncbi:MAG TPA: hypothetical protein VJN21_08445 [Candidatus Acidoferrales bacterium]|nr:hypothetical protein [Candidatus Acidoferrales bacterium]
MRSSLGGPACLFPSTRPTIQPRGIRLGLVQSAAADANASSSVKQVTKSLNNYSLLLAPGALGGILVYVVYPPLDQAFLIIFGLCVLLLPMLLQLRSILRRRLADDASLLRKAYVSSSLMLALLAGFLLLNGALDKSPRSLVQTTLVQKSVSRGRGGATYTLTVSSWRRANHSEDFRVDSRTFSRAAVGEPVTIELHQGYFGVPWSGDILLR